MLAEIMVAALRKGNEGCFTCDDKNHLKGTVLRKLTKNLQKSALSAIEECNGPKTVNLNLTLKENLFWETPSRGPPRSLQEHPVEWIYAHFRGIKSLTPYFDLIALIIINGRNRTKTLIGSDPHKF